ncbi:MAG: AEC family transporter [Verrucomicrobiales bacterium]
MPRILCAMSLAVISAITQMFGLFAVGWLIRRLGYAERSDFDKLSRIAIDFFFPALIFISLLRDLDLSRLRELWALPLLGLGMMAFGAACGWLLKRGLQHRDADTEKSFLHICAINNYGFLPIFIIENSHPGEMLALFFLFHLGSTIGFWTIGVLTLDSGDNWRVTLRRLLTPSLLTIPVAIAAACLNAKDWLPVWFQQVLQKTGALSVPLMIMMIGATVRGGFERERWRDIAYLSVIRVVVLPLVLIALLNILPLAQDVRFLCTIVALMPAAATAAVMTRIYGGDSEYAAAVTLVTTLACIATVPLALHLIAG